MSYLTAEQVLPVLQKLSKLQVVASILKAQGKTAEEVLTLDDVSEFLDSLNRSDTGLIIRSIIVSLLQNE